MMDDRMKVIREALEDALLEIQYHIGGLDASSKTWEAIASINLAFAALDSLAIKSGEPVSNQILTMLREERDAYEEENERLKKKLSEGAKETADRKRVKAEERERVTGVYENIIARYMVDIETTPCEEWPSAKDLLAKMVADAMPLDRYYELRAAIMRTEVEG